MVKSKKDQEYTVQFEEFWAAYPARNGANPKWPAFLKWQDAIKKIMPAELQIAVESYAWSCEGKTEQERVFIPMARAWLFQRRWEKEHPTQGAVDVGKDWDRICRFYLKTGTWLSRTPEPGYGGCGAPKAVLVAHGLENGRQEALKRLQRVL